MSLEKEGWGCKVNGSGSKHSQFEGMWKSRAQNFVLWAVAAKKVSTTCYKWKLKNWGKRRKAEELGKIK